MIYIRRAVWRMLYVDDACIVSRSLQGLAKIIETLVEIYRAFASTVSAEKQRPCACLQRVHRGRWYESKRPDKPTNMCNTSPT